MAYGEWAPYVPVAERRAKADKAMKKMVKKGQNIQPITAVPRRKLGQTFWGKAWCTHLEQLGDFANRLPRGRRYVRNGSVCHLELVPDKDNQDGSQINALVSGSALYEVTIDCKPLAAKKWAQIQKTCSGQVGSLLELLQGRLSDRVMASVTDSDQGLFPLAKEINFSCSCPDWASMCKHVAAVLYGVGVRLDETPEWLFQLRGVDHRDLVSSALDLGLDQGSSTRRTVGGDLSALFDVDLDLDLVDAEPARPAVTKSTANKPIVKPSRIKKSVVKKPAVKKPAVKKTAAKPTAVMPAQTLGLKGKVTATKVKRLRRHFELDIDDFAILVGVSAASIRNWEKQSGTLGLHSKNQGRLSELFNTDKTRAKRKLNRALNQI